MGREIERKFLVTGEGWRTGQRTLIRQGYLRLDEACTVRVRVKRRDEQEQAYITVKGKTAGATRAEYEYEIPADEAGELLERFFKNGFLEGTSREAIYRTDFLERYLYLQDFSKGFLGETYVVAGRQACWKLFKT